MNDLEVRLEQNRKDQQKLKEEEDKILQEIKESKKPKWEFGDIAEYYRINGETKIRYLLRNGRGNLTWFAKEEGQYSLVSSQPIEYQAQVNGYRKVGNLFGK